MLRTQTLRTLLTCTAAAACSLTALAQPAPPTWVVLDPAVGPGTPPSVVVNAALSTTQQTVLDISIPGFYVKDVDKGAAGVFKELTLPGQTALNTLRAAGKPALPVITNLLGIPTDAPGCAIGQVNILATQALAGYQRVIPAQEDITLQDGPLSDPGFDYDQAFYATPGQYPAVDAALTGDPGSMYRVRIQPTAVYPFSVDPSTGVMTCDRQMQVIFTHAGNNLAPINLTRRTAKVMDSLVANFVPDNGVWFGAPPTYDGNYLIIYDWFYDFAAFELAEQKKERGFKVTLLAAQEIPDTIPFGFFCPEVKDAIQSWFETECGNGDAFVLLMGEENVIPEGVALSNGDTYASDSWYASMDDDIFPELNIGRLIMHNPTQAQMLVDRILAYEDSPVSSNYYEDLLLAAHERVDHHFAEYMDLAAGGIDDLGLNILKRYGENAVGTSANIWSDLNAGKHLVVYDGHGSTYTWAGWDFNDESFDSQDIPTEYEPAHLNHPWIMVNYDCINGWWDNPAGDCLNERFMLSEGGPVLTYGANGSSRVAVNNQTVVNMMQFLYNNGITTAGHLFNSANVVTYFQMLPENLDSTTLPINILIYLLFGDPEMTIWRENPVEVNVPNLPLNLHMHTHSVELLVLNGQGQPAAGSLVALYKNGEVAANAHADASGNVSIPVEFDTPGDLVVRVWDDSGEQMGLRAVIPVTCAGDFNYDGVVTVADFFSMLAAWFAADIRADWNGNLAFDVPDIFGFLAVWFQPC